MLEAVAKAENIVATDEEYDEEIKKMADAYQMDLAEINDMIGAFDRSQSERTFASERQRTL